MSNIEEVRNFSDAKGKSATEEMTQVFDDLRQNHPKALEKSDLVSFQLHGRYCSLPDMSSLFISTEGACQSTTAIMMKAFSDLRENRPIAVDRRNNLKSSQTIITSRSMPNMAFVTNSEDDLPEAMPSVKTNEINDLKDSASAASTDCELMIPATVTGSSGIDPLVSSILPTVQPVKSDALQVSWIVGAQLGDAESGKGSTKPPDQDTASEQEMETRGGCGDVAGTVTSVTTVRRKRRSLWSRVKRFAQQMCCCGINDSDE